MAVGEPASTCTEFEKSSADPDMEIVTTSGYGKNGALCVLQRSIKPQVFFHEAFNFELQIGIILRLVGSNDVRITRLSRHVHCVRTT